VDAEHLLALLQRMEADELTIHWQRVASSASRNCDRLAGGAAVDVPCHVGNIAVVNRDIALPFATSAGTFCWLKLSFVGTKI